MYKYNLRKEQSGYSLFNLLVSIGVIVLLTTISIPYLRKYQPNLKLSATARDLVSDLRYAQQLTITEQIPHSVNFDINNGLYQIFKLDVATTTIKTVEFDSNINFQDITGLSGHRVIFNYYGGVSQAGEIFLVNTNNVTATVNIKPSGYIKLE
ncbi:MAG: hypothetical protein ABIE43_00490 [Patescibacteria group bacterium]